MIKRLNPIDYWPVNTLINFKLWNPNPNCFNTLPRFQKNLNTYLIKVSKARFSHYIKPYNQVS
jgi:hypothetical protein